MTTATKTETVSITPQSRNLSLGWAIGQNEKITCPKKRVGLKGLEAEIAEAKRVAGGLYYHTALFVDGCPVVDTRSLSVNEIISYAREFGYVNVVIEVAE